MDLILLSARRMDLSQLPMDTDSHSCRLIARYGDSLLVCRERGEEKYRLPGDYTFDLYPGAKPEDIFIGITRAIEPFVLFRVHDERLFLEASFGYAGYVPFLTSYILECRLEPHEDKSMLYSPESRARKEFRFIGLEEGALLFPEDAGVLAEYIEWKRSLESDGPRPSPTAPPNNARMRLEGFGFFVKDMGVMIRFYRDVLGFEITDPEDADNVYLVKDEVLFLLFRRRDFEAMTGRAFEYVPTVNGHFEIAFGVDNHSAVDATFARVVFQGAAPIMEPRTMPWGQRTCYVADPEGNLIEIGSFTKG